MFARKSSFLNPITIVLEINPEFLCIDPVSNSINTSPLNPWFQKGFFL